VWCDFDLFFEQTTLALFSVVDGYLPGKNDRAQKNIPETFLCSMLSTCTTTSQFKSQFKAPQQSNTPTSEPKPTRAKQAANLK
jgi:hypothetical protein